MKQFTIDLARQAGEMIRTERAEADLEHSYKFGNELVTQADLKADKLICDAIRAQFPAHSIVSEESAPDTDHVQEIENPFWIIDPIDGTVNYAHGHIQSAVSIAYAEQGRVVLGVVFNPFTNEMFHAQLGSGAFLNDQPISVASETDLRRAIIATGFPYKKEGIATMVDNLHRILDECADIRRLGSAALDICWVAAGRLDGYYESLSLWDFAAARLIAAEAGAECGHFRPVPAGVDPAFHNKDLLIANPGLFPQLKRLLTP